MRKKHIFGPVASRRLGRSLGVDIIPAKTCTMDCAYCECGKTTCLTMERKEYVPAETVLAELREVLASRPPLDFITFSGAGEPTLNSAIGEIISGIKREFPEYRICLLTNSSFLNDDALLEEISPVDVVMPSLDALTEEEFAKLNRPAPGLRWDDILNGIVKASKALPGALWLEIFIAPGINDSDEALARFVKAADLINPAKILLNTLDRPGTDKDLKPVSPETLHKFAEALKSHRAAPAGKSPRPGSVHSAAMPRGEIIDAVTSLVYRRPSTESDIEFALNIDRATLREILDSLLKSGVLAAGRGKRGLFYEKPA
jgi:wyosine [tRNA(Phe)-imidazoG37] synthetase (radical SAM superfamily)